MLVGVDIGGTFTDLVLSVDGDLTIHKLLSTPDNPARAMLAGLEAITPGGLEALIAVAHGTTVATNAILERKGARTALITTQGFRDVLFIGRQNRPVLYALHPTLPPPLIPRALCFEVPERLDHTGAVLTPLDLDALDAVLDDLAAHAVESVAVCLLYSYVNPAHERAIRDRIRERGLLEERQIALSCEVLPEFREYERASTVALNAYVRPVMDTYLGSLEDDLPDGVNLRVMKSDGGVVSARLAREQAIQTALSGPAAGVIGAFHLAQLAGYDRVITLDMGGTSTDVALCPGAPVRRPESEIDGLPLRIRLIDIETVGAGGGSIARLDAGGALRVGPESAGADPGPIVYGRGGQQVTVSDANAVLGRINPTLPGNMQLDVAAARAALDDLGGRMNKSAVEAALGVVDVANVNIDRAVRRVSVARGHDPRGFTLVAFGGAGPMHACDLAERLNIERVLVPRFPGVLCAFGLLVADVALDYAASVLGEVTDETPGRLSALLGELVAAGRDDLLREGIREDEMVFEARLDMRYAGQAYELSVPYSDALDTADGLRDAFHAAHTHAYGHALRGRPVETVNLRVQAVGRVQKPQVEPESLTGRDEREGLIDTVNGVKRVDRDKLLPGAGFDGAALIYQLDSSTRVAPGWSARVDGYRNLILEKVDR